MTTPQPDSPAPAPKIDDGGPAFPMPNGTERATFYGPGGSEYTRTVDVAKGGLTIRDYFAAAAMQGMIGCGGTYDKWATLARDAFDVADAMLAARKGGVA